MALVTVSSKGRVTLPGDVRQRLGLEKGDMLTIEEKDGAIVLRPAVALYSDQEIEDLGKEDSLTREEKERFDRDLNRMVRKTVK